MERPHILVPALVPKYGIPEFILYLKSSIKLNSYNLFRSKNVFPPPVKIPSQISVVLLYYPLYSQVYLN